MRELFPSHITDSPLVSKADQESSHLRLSLMLTAKAENI